MNPLIELTTALASRLDLLAGLIRRREEVAEQTICYLLMHSDCLTPERREELERHMQEQTASLRDMKTEYCRLLGKKS